MERPPASYEEFRRNREIPREPAVPALEFEDVLHITQTVFFAPAKKESDLIWVFGSSDRTWSDVAEAYKQGLAPYILVTGNLGKAYFETGKPLAAVAHDALSVYGVPEEAILTQPFGNNTLEEVAAVRQLMDSQKLCLESILYACKSHHSGRVYLTLSKHFPAAVLTALTSDAIYDGVAVSRHDWAEHPVSRSRVYAEFLRIQTYAQRGDIRG